MAEMHQLEHARCGSLIVGGELAMIVSRIDRVYCSWPSLVLTQLRRKARLNEAALALYG